MTGYREIDDQITEWARRHKLFLSRDDDSRNAFVSSEAGECFQMWIQFPVGGHVAIHATFNDGPVNRQCNVDWTVPTANLGSSLDELFAVVEGWMEPSKRYFPPSSEADTGGDGASAKGGLTRSEF